MRWISIVALISLTSCNSQAKPDCGRLDATKVTKCMESNSSKGDKAMLLKCLPFSNPEKIVGVWVIGFEKNDFFEGDWPSTPPPVDRGSTTELVVEKDYHSSAPYDALWVEVTGRRSLCEFTRVTPNLIIVDNLKVKRRVELYAR